ncbi:MAG TPA: RNA polymerase subunit sigma-70 [Arsenophonus nasoniae]|uniref:RNA polymerase subunit sigma-70 n=1 Tax=Arsenophonus nasoniae TaxID=638 RepID=UPI003879D673
MKTMSVSKYAKHAGVTRQTVYDWEKYETFPERINKNIDVEAADKWRKQFIDSKDPRINNAKKGDMPESESLESRAKEVYDELQNGNIKIRSVEESRAIKEHYLAELVKLDHDIKAGAVLPWKDMIEGVRVEYARMRTRLIAIAPEHGPRLRALASTVNDHQFVAALREVIYEAMEELSLDDRERPTHN